MFALLRRRDFALVWTATLISATGDWVLFIGLPIYVYQLTGSTLATSAMFVAELVPQIALGSVAGVFVDRWDRKRTMVVANLVLTVALLPLAFVRSADHVWIVYVVAFTESLLARSVRRRPRCCRASSRSAILWPRIRSGRSPRTPHVSLDRRSAGSWRAST